MNWCTQATHNYGHPVPTGPDELNEILTCFGRPGARPLLKEKRGRRMSGRERTARYFNASSMPGVSFSDQTIGELRR